MENFKTDQENFWAGEFGDEYTTRNQGQKFLATNLALFSRILKSTELGANIGINLQAIEKLLPRAKLTAVEINENAFKKLQENNKINAYHSSLLDFSIHDCVYDFVLAKRVLIHINPDFLPKVYDLMYQLCERYICLAEYYNPTPTEVPYRGYSQRLFKRDFAGDLLDRFSDLKLIDYGFVYHRDRHFPQDDMTWFLLEKQ
jgi:spore coat polysaccharide biosynthesis protein SpsF